MALALGQETSLDHPFALRQYVTPQTFWNLSCLSCSSPEPLIVMRFVRGFILPTRIVASAALVFVGACGDKASLLEPNVALVPSSSAMSQAGLVTVFGPVRLTRTAVEMTETITIPTAGLGSQLTLRVRSG